EFLEKVCGNGAFAAEKAVTEPIEPQAETDAPPPPAAESLPEVEAIPEPAAPEQVAEIITDEEAAPSAEDLESLTAELAAKVSIDENVEDGEISESLEEGETGEKSTDDEELEQVARSLMEDIEVYEQEESKPQSASLKHKVQAGEVISGEEQFGEGEALEQEEPVSQQENEEELPGLAEVNSEHSPTGIEEKEDLGRDSDNGQAGGEEPAPEIGLSESVPEESVAPDLDSAVAEMMGEPGARSEPGAAEEEPAELDSAVAEMMGEPGARSEPGTAEEEPADMDSAIAEMMGGPEASSSSAAAPASVPVDLDAIMSAAAGTDLDTSPGPGEPAPVAEESEEGRGDEEVEEGKKEPEEEPGGNHFSDSLIEEGQVELSQPVVEDTAVTEPGGNGQGEERDNGKEAESFSGEEEGEVERTEEAEKEVPEEGIIDLGGEQEKEDSPGDNTDAPALSLDEKLAITMGDDGQGDTEGVLSVNQTIDAIKKKTVKCPVCGNMNYAIRWYCENCEATLTSL
ncbi:MAG: hypothetical protein U9P14_02005, partial [Gemmatimonadota bacterium]|nr:hypothetical protein [Gemmatimonadota bacterium]